MTVRLPALALALVLLAAPLASVSGPAPADEVRALWVTRHSLTSAETVEAMVRAARESGFNTLLVQVRGRGDAYFTGGLEPRPDVLAGRPAAFDPLALTISLARRHGLRVHAWVNVNLVSSAAELPASREHVLYRHPEWLMVPRALAVELARVGTRSPQYIGRLARWTRAAPDVEGLFTSPVAPEAAAHVEAVVDDLVSRYALDGVHLDYVRYPSSEFDYSLAALKAFRKEIESLIPAQGRRRYDPNSIGDLIALADLHADRWGGFRRSRLNALVMRLRTVVKRRLPDATFSAAVFPDPAEAAGRRLQDWRLWVENGLIDVVCPMAYTPDATTFAAQIASARQLAGPQRVWAGIGAYRLSSSQTVANIATARRLGADGVVLFSYDSLTQPPRGADYLSTLGRAAFLP